MAVPVDPRELTYERNTLTFSDFNAARDNNASLSQGVVGEIGEAEVGEDGVLAQYDAILVGQPPKNATGDRKGNEIYAAVDDGAGSVVSDTVQVSVAARNKGETGGGKDGKVTGFLPTREMDNSDPGIRPPIGVQPSPNNPKYVPDGRIVQFLIKDETGSVTGDITGSTSVLELPILGGK
jgi:hypothetical protein